MLVNEDVNYMSTMCLRRLGMVDYLISQVHGVGLGTDVVIVV